MGQYYIPISLDKEEYMHAWDYENGAKLTETSWVGNYYINTIANLLLKGNPWYKNRLIFAGDYTKKKDFDYYKEQYADNIRKLQIELKKDNSYYKNYDLEDIYINIYKYAERYFNKIIPKEVKCNKNTVIKFFFNDTKKEYVNINNGLKNNLNWIMHPLPLLTCTCNHSNGSYYCRGSEDAKYIGSWKGDVIFAANKLHDVENYKDFKLIKPPFYEK